MQQALLRVIPRSHELLSRPRVVEILTHAPINNTSSISTIRAKRVKTTITSFSYDEPEMT
jgi:hypothetical protein